MEIREFAERILFGQTLEDKLFTPNQLSDSSPLSKFILPELPGRPKHLNISNTKHKLPSVHHLENKTNKGQLLHSFANHELLAIELMALALLKFHDAPKAFRRGLLQTLFEEQLHTRLYLDHMRLCEIEFGEYPLNRYFWDCLYKLDQPMEYICHMSLTFEQANLDYALFYQKCFNQIGDTRTANLLKKIYQDEIRHVKYGLKWFHRWKPNNLPDWECYQQHLHFPITPARAKGKEFDFESRVKAGFEKSYIEQLEVFQASKGRPPDIYYFNPIAERVIANPKFPKNSSWSISLTQDMSPLMAFLGKSSDIVLLPKEPSIKLKKVLQSLKIDLPQFIELPFSENACPHLFKQQLGTLRPWARSPDSEEKLKGLSSKSNSKEPLWNPAFREFHSKSWSKRWLQTKLTELNHQNLISLEETGVCCNSYADLKKSAQRLKQMDTTALALKAPFSAAGQQIILIRQNEFLEKYKEQSQSILNEQREILLEPWLNRVLDISIQGWIHRDHFEILGTTSMKISKQGKYLGAFSGNFINELNTDLKKFIFSDHAKIPIWHCFWKTQLPSLLKPLFNANYEGPFGIDSYIYKNPKGELRYHPISELNLRYTMGSILVSFDKKINPGQLALLQFINIKKYKWNDKHINNIFKFQDKHRPKLCKNNFLSDGILFLNDPLSVQRHLCCLIIANSTKACQNKLDLLTHHLIHS